MYHRYKHQRATQHLIELYEANRAGNGTEEQVNQAVLKLDQINRRICEINREYDLPEELGIIDYGAFLYGWNFQPDRALRAEKMEAFCRRKKYMRGWGDLPPTRAYEYFEDHDPGHPDRWESITTWLRLIWVLLRQHRRAELIDDLKGKLCEHVRDTSDQLDALAVLTTLHRMSQLLDSQYSAVISHRAANQYEEDRVFLHRMCNFLGFPAQWVPDDYAIEHRRHS